MEKYFESVLKHPISAGILVAVTTAGIAKIIRAATDFKN